MRSVSKSELLKLIVHRRIYVLTSFGTAVLTTRKSLIEAMPKNKEVYSIDLGENHIVLLQPFKVGKIVMIPVTLAGINKPKVLIKTLNYENIKGQQTSNS